jgi:hypothetical protein
MDIAAELTHQGIIAHLRGNLTLAANLFQRATEVDPHYELAWLWRSSVAATDDERRSYLQQALIANPQSESALRGLVMLGPADRIELGGVKRPREE